MAEGQEVNGYLLFNADGKKLTGSKSWGDLDGEGGVWDRVFTRTEVDEILKESQENNWGIKPDHLVPAKWNGKTVIETGLPLDFDQLPPLETKS